MVGAALAHEMVGCGPVAVAVEKRADDAAVEHSRESLVMCRRGPLRDHFVANGEALDVEPEWVRGTAAEAGVGGGVALLERGAGHDVTISTRPERR